MNPTRRDALKSAVAVGALAVLPAAAAPKQGSLFAGVDWSNNVLGSKTVHVIGEMVDGEFKVVHMKKYPPTESMGAFELSVVEDVAKTNKKFKVAKCGADWGSGYYENPVLQRRTRPIEVMEIYASCSQRNDLTWSEKGKFWVIGQHAVPVNVSKDVAHATRLAKASALICNGTLTVTSPAEIGVKILVRNTPADYPCKVLEWFDTSWDRLLPGDIAMFADEPGKEYQLKSTMYHRKEDGAKTVRLDPVPDGVAVGLDARFPVNRVSDELVRTWMRDLDPACKPIEVARRYWSIFDGNGKKGRIVWIPGKLHHLVDGQKFRFPHNFHMIGELRLFTL